MLLRCSLLLSFGIERTSFEQANGFDEFSYQQLASSQSFRRRQLKRAFTIKRLISLVIEEKKEKLAVE